MPSSKRRLALTNIVDTLASITTANGYATDVTQAAMRAFEWASVWQSYALPVIGVVPNSVAYEYPAKHIIVARQSVAIEFCYRAATQDEAWDRGDALIDDIIGALHLDPTRGGYALHTMVQSAETDAGNPDILDSRGGTAAGIVQVELMLNREWVKAS